MKNINKKIISDISSNTSHLMLKCKLCGQIWAPSIKPDSGGRMYRGSWQCPRKCKLNPLKDDKNTT